jgi:hypothetical protein
MGQLQEPTYPRLTIAGTQLPVTRRVFVAYTIVSALAVWLALAVAEGLAKEQCQRDGLAFQWTTWTCKPYGGTIILPPGLRRAGSD